MSSRPSHPAEPLTARLLASSTALSVAARPEDVAQVVLGHAAAGMDTRFGALYRARDDGSFEALHTVGLEGRDPAGYRVIAASERYPLNEAARTGEAIWLDDVAEATARFPRLEGRGYEAAVAVPLIASGRVLGGFALTFAGAQRFSEEQKTFLLTLAGQGALALERALLFSQEQQSRAAADRERQRLAAVIEQLPQAAVLVDARTCELLLANRRSLALFGTSGLARDRAARQSQFRVTDAQGAPIPLDRWPGARAARGEQVERQLLFVERADGSRVTVEASASPVQGPGGEVDAAVVIYADVTEREQLLQHAEQARREAERSTRDFRDLAEAIPQIVWRMGRDGEVFFNRRWEEYVGAEGVASYLQDKRHSAVHPDDRPLVEERWRHAREHRDVYEAEFRLRRHDGQYRWFLARGVPRLGENGEVVAWFGTSTDIHEHKLAEARSAFVAAASEQLGSSLEYEETLRKVAGLAVPRFADWAAVDMIEGGAIKRVAVAHVDPEKTRLGWELSRRFPARVEDPAGLGKVLRTGEPDFIREITDEMIRAGVQDPEALEVFLALKLRSAITAPMTFRGRTIGAITFVLAESDRRYGEADLATAMDLGRRAAMAVENARLYRDSEAANRSKDEFLAVVSHELRTPLTAVLGYTSMLRAGTLAEGRRERAIEVIDRNVRAQAKLIEDLLDLSRIVSGKLRLQPRPVNLGEVVEAALEAVRPAAEAKGVRVTASLDPEGSAITGDPDRLQQVVWNLLSNAIKFTPRGGQVEVGLRRSGSDAELEVRDSGQGISPGFLPFVFDRFRQADASATRAHGGLGLGLSIVRHLVELHGGTVEVESEGEGRGATFRTRLPARAAVSEVREPAPEEAPRVSIHELRGRRVLVIDDDPDTREVLAAILTRGGALPSTAGSAAEARVRLANDRFDALMCDVGMPGEDGYTFIRWLRAQSEDTLGRLPALALTAYARPEDRARALEQGFDAHLAKPMQPHEVLDAAAELLRPRR